jgi:hypothetical protein
MESDVLLQKGKRLLYIDYIIMVKKQTKIQKANGNAS